MGGAVVPTLQSSILRALSTGPRSVADLRAAHNTHPGAQVVMAIDVLKREGMVQTKWKRLELTRAGRLAAPSPTAQLASQGTYIPPRVVRRAGSEIHRTLPSCVGERRYYRSEA